MYSHDNDGQNYESNSSFDNDYAAGSQAGMLEQRDQELPFQSCQNPQRRGQDGDRVNFHQSMEDLKARQEDASEDADLQVNNFLKDELSIDSLEASSRDLAVDAIKTTHDGGKHAIQLIKWLRPNDRDAQQTRSKSIIPKTASSLDPSKTKNIIHEFKNLKRRNRKKIIQDYHDTYNT
jgi:hypothetical protein